MTDLEELRARTRGGGEPNWLTVATQGRATGKWTGRMQSTFVTGMAGWSIYKQAKTYLDNKKSEKRYRISVPDTDELFPYVSQWVIDQLPEADRRSLRVTTRRNRQRVRDPEWNTIPRATRRAYLAYDGSKTQTVILEGHKVTIGVEEPEVGKRGDDGMVHSSASGWGKPGSLVFTCDGTPAQEAVLRLLQRLTETVDVDESTNFRVNIANKYGGWNTLASKPPRPMESLVLPKGVMDDIIEDLRRFLKNEAAYLKMGLPWHRGYLLHGPPGTGKSSVPQVLAGHFDMEVNYVPLSDLKSDTDLAGLLAAVEDREILLLEDVDVLKAAGHREVVKDDKGTGLTLSGLLQALDGVATPHGLVTFMTTNHRDVLDPAFIREGRVDREYEFTYADEAQVRGIVTAMLGMDPGPLGSIPMDTTPARVLEVIKSSIDDPPADIIARIRAKFAD